jgi:hypothetical protein
MRLFTRIPQLWRYLGVAVFSLLVSLFFVWLAVHRQCPSLGGIGGALGTAAAFASFFLRPDYGLQVYEVLKEAISPELSDTDKLKEQIKAFESALRVNSNGQVIQNLFVATASVIGTLFWALGQYFAEWLLHRPIGC